MTRSQWWEWEEDEKRKKDKRSKLLRHTYTASLEPWEREDFQRSSRGTLQLAFAEHNLLVLMNQSSFHLLLHTSDSVAGTWFLMRFCSSSFWIQLHPVTHEKPVFIGNFYVATFSVSEKNFRDKEKDRVSIWFMKNSTLKAFNASLNYPFFLYVKETWWYLNLLLPNLTEAHFLSGQFSCSVMSNSLQPYGRQYTSLPCPSPPAGVCSNSCPSTQWCHPTISSSVIPFSYCLHSFPALWSFLKNHFFPSGGQSIGASVTASVIPVNIQDWFSLGLTGLTLALIVLFSLKLTM